MKTWISTLKEKLIRLSQVSRLKKNQLGKANKVKGIMTLRNEVLKSMEMKIETLEIKVMSSKKNNIGFKIEFKEVLLKLLIKIYSLH